MIVTEKAKVKNNNSNNNNIFHFYLEYQQAMAAQGSIFEDQKASDKQVKASEQGNIEKMDKICAKGGDIVVEPGLCRYDPS